MEKMRCFTIFKIKECPPLDAANHLYRRNILSIYSICKRKAGSTRAIFGKPRKMSGQNPVWKKINSNDHQGHIIVVNYLHHVTYVINQYNIN